MYFVEMSNLFSLFYDLFLGEKSVATNEAMQWGTIMSEHLKSTLFIIWMQSDYKTGI